MTQAIKIKAVNDYIEALNTQNIDIIKTLYDSDATVEDPYGADPLRGIDAITAFYQATFDANVTANLTSKARIAGDSAAFDFTVEFQGNLIDVIDIFRFNEAGKVISMKAYWSQDNMRPKDSATV